MTSDSSGSAIENPSNNVTNPNADLLTSVVSIRDRAGYLCSGTVVEKNIILTARHCAISRKTKKPYSTGTVLTINGATAYQVVKIEIPSARITRDLVLRHKVNSDLALMLVEPLPGLPAAAAPLEKIKPVSIAKEYTHDPLRQLLIAGYGQTSRFNNETTGKLQSGYIKTYLAPDQKSFFEEKILEQSTLLAIPASELELDVEEFRTFIHGTLRTASPLLQVSQPLSLPTKGFNKVFHSGAYALNGDSGGPVFCRIGSANVLVGVISSGAPNVIQGSRQLSALYPAGGVISSVAIPPKQQDKLQEASVLANALVQLDLNLRKQSYLDEKGLATIRLRTVLDEKIVSEDIYASVTARANRVFLEQALESLIRTRDGI